MIPMRSALQYENEIESLMYRIDAETKRSIAAEKLNHQIIAVSLLLVGVMAYLWYDKHTEATEMRAELAVAVVEGCP